MARYCFYCGRELAPGEKCACRTRTAGTPNAEQAGSSQNRTSSGKSQARPGSGGSSFWSNTKSGNSRKSSFYAKKPPFSGKKPTSGSFFKRKPMDTGAILVGITQYLRYVTRPVDTIRQAVQYLNPSRLLLLSLIHAAIGGLCLIRIDQLGTLDLLMQLTLIQSANPFAASLFLFVQGAGMALVFDWLLILVTHLTLQYVFRSPYALTRVAASFVPVIFYLAVFQLLALLSLTLIPVASLLTLAAGLAIAFLVLYLAIRQLTGFDENRCFVLVTFVTVVFTALISLVINLAMPVLTLLLEQSLPL